MEVHHHTQTPREKFKHYFFEFFMLFLAVFLGYLAERKLEHDIEKIRERSAMSSLLNELNQDIRQIDSLEQRRLSRNADCDLLIGLLSNPVTVKDSGSAIYYYGRNASRRIHFHSQNGVLQQLRNSGGFRVHHSEVQKMLNEYDLLLQNNVENIDVEEKELSEYSSLAAKIYDVKIFQEITSHSPFIRPEGNPVLLSYDKSLLNELGIKLHYWKRTSLTALESLGNLRSIAQELITTIREHYHLK
jgi:hypothetical protein